MIRKPPNSPNYHFRYVYKGKTYSGSTGTSSRYLATQFESKHRDDTYKRVALGEVAEPTRITLAAAMDLYLHDHRHKTAPSTYKVCRTKTMGKKRDNKTHKIVRVYGLRDEPIEHLKARDLQKLINERRNEGNKDSTILYELVFLSVVFKHVKRLGYLVPDIDFDDLKKANKLNGSRGRLRYLSLEEENRLLIELATDLESDNVWVKMCRANALHFTVMLLDIGCRLSELQKLKWSDINMEKKEIQLYRGKVDNESALLMTKRVYEVLVDRLRVKEADQEQVFEAVATHLRSKNNDGLLRCRAALKAACKRAGIKGVSFHTLRHTMASRLVQAGASLYDVQHILGHASSSTTQRYAHLSPKQASINAAAILDRIQEAA